MIRRSTVCPSWVSLVVGSNYRELARGNVQLNTAGMTFLDLDWANRSATTLTCAECGRLQWFLQRPERSP